MHIQLSPIAHILKDLLKSHPLLMHCLVASMTKDGIDSIQVHSWKIQAQIFTVFQDPGRFGFGGARTSERISLKAAAVQLAVAALHNRQFQIA